MNRKRFTLYRSGSDDELGGVGVMAKKELCYKMVELSRVTDKVIVV